MVLNHHFASDPRVRRYVDALVDAGVHVDLLCLQHRVPGEVSGGDRLRIFTIPLKHGGERLAGLVLEYIVAFILFTLYLIGLHVKNRYAVIQAHNIPDFLVFTALVPRLFGAKVILDIRDPMPEFYLSKYAGRDANGSVMRLIRAQERLAAEFAHVVIAANSNFRDNMVRRGVPAGKVVVVNNLPDPKIFNRERHRLRREAPGDAYTLIYPGTIAERYGLDIAVRALPRLREKIPHVRLVILGPDCQHARDLATLAAELGVVSAVEFRPSVPVHQVAEAIARADVGIYPALPDPHMSIATPTKVLEYAAMGIPIVASRLPILESIFSDASVMFFEPGNAGQFAQAVLELYESPAKRSEVVESADEIFVRKYDWTNERNVYYASMNALLAPAIAISLGDDGVSEAP